jgi:HSP20 family protein
MFEMTLLRPNHSNHNPFADFHRDFFRDFAAPALVADRARLPAAEVSENEQAVVIALDVPGVEQKDLDLKVEGDTLTARAEGTRAFTRQFTLPETVDAEKTTAAYKNGVLTITLPKREEVKPKSIQIKVD